jgi:hypothetical protein
MLKNKKDFVEKIALELLRNETLNQSDLKVIFNNL